MKTFTELAHNDLNSFIYGKSKNPVTTKNGIVIGNGDVYPELNFTLPPMLITKESMPEVLEQYRQMTEDAAKRAVDLSVPAYIVEVELLPAATYNPDWGIEIIKTVREAMYKYETNGVKSALRATPVDIREDKESPHMWHGSHWDKIMEVFEGSAKAGAELLAIESIGGKDIHDDALMYCELDKAMFALGVLGVKDMHKLWTRITEIAGSTGSIPSGDTACGFANTAMVLADRGFIPKVFSAVIRVVSSVRSLAAVEAGAVGPHKDCGYEGVYVKAITGIPISMEGKSSACAHLSSIGNIAACVADLWSNESVQNIKLLGGMAPTVSMEQLIYDCRLMNIAKKKSKANDLRDWLCESDSALDPQAYVLNPEVVLRISREILKEKTPFLRAKAAAYAAIGEIGKAIDNKEIAVKEKEYPYLDIMREQLDSIPDDEQAFTEQMLSVISSDKFVPAKYDL
jgi:methanol--5-hydroxybenzimidazolylcobamide Co-methyltransferase